MDFSYWRLRHKPEKIRGHKKWGYKECPFFVAEYTSGKVITCYVDVYGKCFIKEYKLIPGTREYDASEPLFEYTVYEWNLK